MRDGMIGDAARMVPPDKLPDKLPEHDLLPMFQQWVDRDPNLVLEVTLSLTRRQIAALLQGAEEWLHSCQELVEAPGHGIEEHFANDAAQELYGQLITRAKNWMTWATVTGGDE